MNRTVMRLLVLSCLLSIVFLTELAPRIGIVRADIGTVYIMTDGSVYGTTYIQTADNATYVFAANINASIVVERDNITVDGNGYTVQGGGNGTGIDLSGRTNVTVQNTQVKGFDEGILLSSSSNSSVLGNNVTGNNGYGVWLNSSSGNIISGNNLANNGFGIWLNSSSNHNSISKNSVAESVYDGLELVSSSDNAIAGNNVTANGDGGIYLSSFLNSTLSGNTVTGNSVFGIWLSSSSNNTLAGNTMSNNSLDFGVVGSSLPDYIDDVDTNNTVNGRPVYYWIDRQDATVPLGAGYAALVNCTRMTVQSLYLTGNGQGMVLAYTTNSTIFNNTATNDDYGIWLDHSSNNTLAGNKVAGNVEGIWVVSSSDNVISGSSMTNGDDGIWLDSSSDNVISGNNVTGNDFDGIYLGNSSGNMVYHNNFIGNDLQVESDQLSTNTWNNDYPSGGNYWSNYHGSDVYSGPYQNMSGGDGIGDSAYVTNSNNTDEYPLMASFTVFDAGTWNGTSYSLEIVSNSTVSNVQIDIAHGIISFNVAGSASTNGFCRVTMPNIVVQDLWHGNYAVLLNGELWPFRNWTDTTDAYVYINYTQSEHQVAIIPDFPTIMTLPLFTVLLTFAFVLAKRRPRKLRTPPSAPTMHQQTLRQILLLNLF